MERIGKHILDLDSIVHVISLDYPKGYTILAYDAVGHIINFDITLEDSEYDVLVAELGVAESEEYPHTDIQFDGQHFVTEPQHGS